MDARRQPDGETRLQENKNQGGQVQVSAWLSAMAPSAGANSRNTALAPLSPTQQLKIATAPTSIASLNEGASWLLLAKPSVNARRAMPRRIASAPAPS